MKLPKFEIDRDVKICRTCGKVRAREDLECECGDTQYESSYICPVCNESTADIEWHYRRHYDGYRQD